MAWDKGFNCRNTAAYVTDGANHTYVDGTDYAYPQTRNSVTFGLTTNNGLNWRDRDNAVDVRVAGIIFSNAVENFQVDLPATGDYDIWLGCGDPTGAGSGLVGRIIIKDNSTTLFSISHTAATNGLYNAQDEDKSIANWASGYASDARRETFASTTFNLELSNDTGHIFSIIAHIFLSQVSAGGLAIPIVYHHRRRMEVC